MAIFRRANERLEKEIDELGEPDNPLPRRKKKNADELRARWISLSAPRKAIIEAGHEQGLDVARRADASPAAVLGVVVKTAAAAQAA